MNRGFYFKLYILTLAAFLLLDFIWLMFVAKTFYTAQIGSLLAQDTNILAAGLFYAFFIVGLLYFVVLPALKSKKSRVKKVALAGGLFGFITYSTYDLTNYATLAHWPLLLVIVDMAWGFILSALVTALSFTIGKKLK